MQLGHSFRQIRGAFPTPKREGLQKYLEKFPEKFKGVHELQHLGGGVAPWNVKQYRVKSNSDTIVLEEIKGNGEEISLVFYHFQNLKYLSHNIVNINSEGFITQFFQLRIIPKWPKSPGRSPQLPVCRCGRWAASGPAGFRGSSRAAGRGPGT